MPSTVSDISLFEEFKNGDDEAFAALYHRYAEQLVDYASLRVESLDEAKDLIQDLFITLWEKKAMLHIEQSVKAYLFKALKRRLLNHYRSHATRESYKNHLERMEVQYFFGPDSIVESKETLARIEATVEKMSPNVRKVYLMSREEHLNTREIAERLQVSEQTVKNQITTALNLLRKNLKLSVLLALIYLLLR